MKKLSCLLCAVAVLLCAVSCGAATPASPATTVTELPEVAFPGLSAREKLASLPVADASMSEEELRDLCVKFFELSGTFQWTPSETISYLSGKKTLTFEKGVLYGGLPYTHASSNVYTFLDYCDEATGVVDTSALQLTMSSLLGNDCADAVFWAWARVSNTISFKLTDYMQPKRGCLLLGDYQYKTDISNFREVGGTRDVCEANGTQKMYEAYALLKKADGLVCWNTGGGHAQMVVSNHVVRNADGTINGPNSKVTVIEQVSTLTPTERDGVTLQVECGYHKEYSYATLFSGRGYLPICIAELAGLDPVEKAEVTLDVPADADLDKVLTAKVNSNYRVSKMIITVLDGDGKTPVYTLEQYGTEATMYSFSLKDVFPTLARRDIKEAIADALQHRNPNSTGSCSIKIEMLVSTGETLLAYSGAIPDSAS